MSQFKSGDICIYDGPVKSERAKGIISTRDEITIIKRHEISHEYWQIDRSGPNGERVFCEEKYLRKKRPPESYKDQFTPYDKSYPELLHELNELTKPLTEETVKQVFEQSMWRAEM
jgi:hypothetical protein